MKKAFTFAKIKRMFPLPFGERVRVRGYKAFTLAEVLITLGVIGVVAAMTMPTLIQNYKKKEATTKLKKFYSVMTQAIKLSEIDNGPLEGWDMKAVVKTDGGDKDYETTNINTKDFFLKYLAPYMKYVDIKNNVKENSENITVYLADGSMFTLHTGSCMDFGFDLNGDKSPNEYGRDKFKFLMCIIENNQYYNFKETYCGSKDIYFCPKWSKGTRESRLEKCRNDGSSCSGLLFYDDWEFKDDYPYRL